MNKHVTPKVVPAFRPRPPSRRSIPVKAAIDWQESIALTGKGLGLFVLFTSSMNWWFYRRVREEAEKDQKK